MPVTVKVIDGKARVVEAATGKIARNKAGTPVDGNGHDNVDDAKAQARAINANLKKRK